MLEVEGLRVELPLGERTLRPVDDVELPGREGPVARPGRRVGLGQDDGPARDRRAAGPPRPDRRRQHPLRRHRADLERARRSPPGARHEHRDDLPGADDRAEPGDAGRRADRRGPAGAARPGPAPVPRPGARADAAGRHPRPRAALPGLPARALGRPAAADHDRHRAVLRAARDPLRRADHRARRDDPGPDPEAAGAPARGARRLAGLRLPRPRGGRPDLPDGGGDVCRPGGRDGHRRRGLPPAPASVHARAAALRARLRRRPRHPLEHPRHTARPGLAAAGLPLPSALPVRPGRLPLGRLPAAAARRRPGDRPASTPTPAPRTCGASR